MKTKETNKNRMVPLVPFVSWWFSDRLSDGLRCTLQAVVL